MKQIEVTVVVHTHWDREWYWPFQIFRIKLVDLIDSLIEILTEDSDFKQFHLDGQTIVLEDYLEVRPQKRGLLQELIKAGRILIGPWYVLPDEFLVSGEALIRNLLLGDKIAKQFGQAMRVGYLPDQFGHISQMPQILRGFGLDNAVLWRGLEYSKTRHNEFYWESPDGTRVLGIHLPPRGYGGITKAANDTELSWKKIEQMLDFLVSRSATGEILLMYGDDHVFPEEDLPQFLKRLNDKSGDVNITQGSLEEYIAKVRSRLDEVELAVLQGEFISSKDTYVIQSVHSSRMYLKQRNHECETLLERWVEPTSIYKLWLGGNPKQELIWLAWKWLLKNHPHDSICGCSIDQVHREMLIRFDWSREIAEELIAENLRYIASRINTQTLLADDQERALIVFNPTNFEGSQVVEGECYLPAEGAITEMQMFSQEGNCVPFEVLSGERSTPTQLEKYFAGHNKALMKARVRFLSTGLPPNGYTSYRLAPAGEKGHHRKPHETDIRTGPNRIENKHYIITGNPDGTIDIVDKEFQTVYHNCLHIEDQGDRGDEYTFDSLQEENPIFVTAESMEVIDHGPLQASIRVKTSLELPTKLNPSRTHRSQERRICPLETIIILYAGTKRIDFRTTFENRVTDHRLRVLFLTGVKADTVQVEENFDVATRSITVSQGIGWKEAPYPTKHFNRFLYLSDHKKGFGLISKGLPEYEVLDNAERTVALTLLRAVGSLARHDLNNRRDAAGPVFSTPEAQCLGKHTFEYAAYTHSGYWKKSEMLRQANLFITPPRIIAKGKERGELPEQLSFFDVQPYTLEISAIKKAESGELSVLRIYNPTDQDVEGTVNFWQDIKEAQLMNLKEEEVEQLTPFSNTSLKIAFGKKEIKTIAVRFAA